MSTKKTDWPVKLHIRFTEEIRIVSIDEEYDSIQDYVETPEYDYIRCHIDKDLFIIMKSSIVMVDTGML